MNLHTTDINDFEAVAAIAKELPTSERELFTAQTGASFDVEEFLVTLAEIVGDAPHQYTFWAGENPVAVGGFLPQRPGVFRTWFMAPEWAWAEHGADLTERCRAIIQELFAAGLAHRIETVTLAHREEARAWYERIGLTFEALHPGYGANGEDAVTYVAVRKVETH